jgi:predicted lipid-binding transport protein (Tim44 family)
VFEKLKEKLGMIESARTTLPINVGSGDLAHAFETMLDSKNIRQLSFLDDFQQMLVSTWMAWNDVDNDEDVELFSSLMLDNLMHTSVSVAGYRSESFQNMTVGQLSRDFQIELANIKSRGRDGELSEVL